MARRWSDLSPRSRRLILAAALAETGLKAAVLADLRRRPASQVRGSRRGWGGAVVGHSAGGRPLWDFSLVRRRPPGVSAQPPPATAAAPRARGSTASGVFLA